MTPRPTPADYAPFYETYVRLVPEDDLLAALEAQREELRSFLGAIAEDASLVRHAPYTWSTREVVGHLTDAERVFGHRAFRFSRGDATPLPGFDEGPYAAEAQSDRIPLADLAAELDAVRAGNLLMFRHLRPECWTRSGEANGSRVTVNALAAILVGHPRHHLAILKARHAAP